MLGRAERLIDVADIDEAIVVKPKPCFCGQDSADGFVEPRFFDLARLDCALHSHERLFNARRVQKYIGPGFDCAHRGFALRVVSRDTAHIKSVGEYYAVELQLAAKNACQHLWRERCGKSFRFNLRQRNVRTHHATDAFFYRGSEWCKLDRLQPPPFTPN